MWCFLTLVRDGSGCGFNKRCLWAVMWGKVLAQIILVGFYWRSVPNNWGQCSTTTFRDHLPSRECPKCGNKPQWGLCPKVRHAMTLNDFRPIALTSLIMKCLENLVKEELLSETKTFLDLLQFAYSSMQSVQGATLTVLNMLLRHIVPSVFIYLAVVLLPNCPDWDLKRNRAELL